MGLLLVQNTFYTSSSKHVLKTAVLVEPLSKPLRGLVVKYQLLKCSLRLFAAHDAARTFWAC